MRVFWWQAGLHIEPENDDDRGALVKLCEILKLSSLGTHVGSGTQATHAEPADAPRRSAAQDSPLDPSPRQTETGQWLPIETAPKDERNGITPYVLLGWIPDEEGFTPEPHEGFWHVFHQAWVKSADINFVGPQPTHWMPLPSPPQIGSGTASLSGALGSPHRSAAQKSSFDSTP